MLKRAIWPLDGVNLSHGAKFGNTQQKIYAQHAYVLPFVIFLCRGVCIINAVILPRLCKFYILLLENAFWPSLHFLPKMSKSRNFKISQKFKILSKVDMLYVKLFGRLYTFQIKCCYLVTFVNTTGINLSKCPRIQFMKILKKSVIDFKNEIISFKTRCTYGRDKCLPIYQNLKVFFPFYQQKIMPLS